jgi:hypothetical protein
MASINASTTSGVITTADNTGILNLQSNGTTVATINSAGFNLPTNNTLNAANTFGFKNRIINGGMVLDQRNAGAAVTPANGQYLTDRWAYGASQASKVTAGQGSGGAPTGFTNYLAYTSASAYSVLSSDFFLTLQHIEGFNTADLGWGTANAKTVTLSFVVFSSLTGTFGGSLRNGAANRSYPFSYSIPVANTWTTVSVTIPGDTTGTWLTNNGVGVSVIFSLGAGSTLSGTAGAWTAGNLTSAIGAVSVVGTNGATFYITGVQLERGSQATSFDFRSYGTELALCQRYFTIIRGTASNPTVGVGTQASTTAVAGQIPLPVTMRSGSPTITGGISATDAFAYNQGVTLSSNEVLTNCLYVTGTIPTNGAAGRATLFVLNGTASAIGIATEL